MVKSKLIVTFFILIGYLPVKGQSIYKINVDDNIQLAHLQDSIFIHITFHHLEGFGMFSSNGLIIIKNGQALMIDTPMDDDKTERLTRYLKDSLSVSLTKLIIGHFHNDCMGGLKYLQSIGIESIANSMTIDKCKEVGLPLPSSSFTDSLIIDFNGEKVECQYFGAGHSLDNITVWIPDKKILFGGCLVKSTQSTGLGNLSDAVMSGWDLTVKKLMKRYPIINMVIPGHGNFGGQELLTHSIELIEKQRTKY